MSNLYLVLKKKQEEEVNNFPMVFAFNNDQFKDAMEKLGLSVDDTDKIYSIGGGGYIRKIDSAAMNDMFERHTEEMQTAIASDPTGDGFIFDMFNYELANHEFVINRDVDPTLDALGFTIDEVNANERLIHGLNRAVKNQRSY